MMHWLGKFMRLDSVRERYEEDIRHQQQERNREYAEQQRRELEERLEYLTAMAEAVKQSQADRDNDHSR